MDKIETATLGSIPQVPSSGTKATATSTNNMQDIVGYDPYFIKGNLISVEIKLEEATTMVLSEDQIKADLARKLAEQLLRSNVINFTKQTEIDTLNHIFRAYLYVTPNDQTEIIRKFVKGIL